MQAFIFGAGKIARGFLGQLLYRAGFEMTFVDASEELTKSLNDNGKYYVNVMGSPEDCEWIDRFRCLPLTDEHAVREAYCGADVIFTAVGGKNLPALGPVIAEAFREKIRQGDFAQNIICCENWNCPADVLTEAVCGSLSEEERELFRRTTGISEAAVMRSGIEASEEVRKIDPLGVSVSNYWELPVDQDRLVGNVPDIKGLIAMPDFGGFLQRKICTFNGSNALIAYIGTLLGYQYLADAANDKWIVGLLDRFYAELNNALCLEYGVSQEEQAKLARQAREKYQDYTIVDYLERHARDPLRKLSPGDRLVKPALLIEKAGGDTGVSALAIAAALYYRSENEADRSAAELSEMRTQMPIEDVMRKICGIERNSALGGSVMKQIGELRGRGLLT